MSINSIYSKLSTLVETKRLLRQAIIDKGVPVKKDRDTFRDYVTKINNIVQESPHGKNAPYIDDSLVFCEDYSEIQASKLDLASDSSILDMECPFTVELSFVLDSSVELTQSFETFIDFSFVRIGAQRVSDQQLYLMYGEHLPSDPSFWSYTMWLTDNSNPTSDCILPKDQVVTITCVRYSDHALIYKNGELIITSEESFTELFDTAFSIYRPFDTDAAGYHSVINTTINNVRIYNKALNENEIYYNYSIDLLNNGNTQYLNTNHIKSGLVYGINPILPLTGINSHDNVSNYNNHFDNLSIPISLQNGFTIEWRGSISDIMSNDNEPYDYTGRLFTFKNSNGTDTFEVCATIDSEDTDIFDIGFKASDEYLIDSEDWLEVFSDTLPSIKFSSDFTLSITVSSTAVNVYIDGVLEASSSTYQNEFTNANLWKILYLFTNSLESPLQGTDGFLYSLRIYNRVLNEYEINYNYKVDTRSDIKNPDPLYGKAILGELGNMTLNASGVIIPKAFDCSKPFEIVSCFKMKSDESENDKNFALFGSSDASNYSAYPSIEIRPYTNKLWVGVSINPNNWTYTQEVDLSDIPIVYDNNVLNWIKMDYDGDKIYLSHSIDCLSWTRFHTITGIVPYNPVTNDYTLIFGAKLQNSDLTYTYKSDGETSFSFMNSWVKSCNKTIWGREIMGQELYTNNSTVLVPNGDVRYNAGSFIAYSNLDMSDDFEVVVCLAIDKTAMTSSQTYYLAGGITSSTSNFRIYATYYNIGYQIFYGTHTVAEDDVSWEDTVSNFIYNEGVQNFLKLKKRDGKVSFYHSLDAINWSLLNEVEIDSETFTNLQDDGIRFGNAGSDTSTALPMTDTSFINLHNSYVKVNGEIVWGREIREKAQVYAPEIKRETVLYQPNIDTYDPIDSYTPIDNLGEGNCVIPISDIGKYQNYLTFNKVYNSKLVIPVNPFAYDITNLSFTINFPSPRNNGRNSILGFNAKKMYVNVSDDDMLSENFIYLSLVTTDNVSDDDKSLRLSVGNVNEIIRTNNELVYKTTHDGSSNYNNSPSVAQIFFNKTEFPISGWNSDKKIDFIFNNIHNTLTVMIDNIEAVVLEFNNTIPYQFLPISATFGFFDDGRVNSPSTISMYMKDIVCKIEGSVMIRPLTVTKNIKENGIYMATDDNAEGYSAVTVNVPQRAAAEGGLIISNGALKLPLTMDSADPFEVVMCVRIDPDDIPTSPSFKFIVGCFEGVKQAFYLQMYKEDGHIFVNSTFLCGTHEFAEGNYYEIFLNNPEDVLNCDGEAWNYLKIVKTADLKYQIWYSTDGTAYTLADEAQLPNNMTNLYTFTPIIPAPVELASERRWDLQDICLPNCYFKYNGTVVWGREIGYENINTNEYALPKSDITILKSIKSTGNSVIPTNIIPDYDWSVFLDAKFENPHSTRDVDIVFGILRSDEHFCISMQQGPGWASYTAISGYTAQSGDTYSIGDATSITRNLGIRQCCIMRRGTNKKCSFGDLSFEMTVKTTDSVPYKPITIMGTINESTETLNPYDHYDATLYGIQIMDASDKLIHNFVPALSNISKRTGMYDLITETFYQSDKNFDDFEKEFIYDNTSISNYFDDIVAPVTFLKSVKSVGNSVVHTDIVLDFSWEVSMLLMFSGEYRSSSPTDCFFGVQGADPWWLAAYNNNNINVFIGFDYTKYAASMSASGWNDHVTFLRMKRDELCIYGNKTSSIPTAISGDPHDFGASFFGVSFNNTNDGKFAYYDMTIYDVEIFNSEKELIHKLVPAENNATGRGGLYDVITNKFYPAKYDDLIKEYGSNATRSPYNVYRILNPREYNQNGIVLSLSDFTDNADYYVYTLPIASSAGVTLEFNLSFTAFENRSGIGAGKEQMLFDSRIDSNDRYSMRITYISEGQYALRSNKNSSLIYSSRYVSDNEVHTYTLTVCADGVTKIYVDGELWDTINSDNIGVLYREFYLFTSYEQATGWTFYPSYRTVNRIMIYNRALSEQEILENRKADIINFGE
jgi:hypothetical protein